MEDKRGERIGGDSGEKRKRWGASSYSRGTAQQATKQEQCFHTEPDQSNQQSGWADRIISLKRIM
jgi:hypothetical protein